MKKLCKKYGWVVVIIIGIIFIMYNSPTPQSIFVNNEIINMGLPGPADLDIPEKITHTNE